MSIHKDEKNNKRERVNSKGNATNLEEITFCKAIKMSLYNAMPTFVTLLIAKVSSAFSFNFLKGYPNEYILAAYGIGNGFLNILCYAAIYSLCMGLLTRLAQAYGDKAYRLLGYYLHRGFIINIYAFLVIALLIYFSDKAFLLFNYKEELATYTRTYLLWSLPAVFLYMVFTTLQYYLFSVQLFFPTAVMQVISTPIYVIVAYYLTVTNNHGLIGSAWALTIQNASSCLMIIAYIWYKNPSPESMFLPDKISFQKIWDLFKHEFLIGSVVFIQWIGVEIIGLGAGSLPVAQTSAYTATYQVTAVYYMFPVALDNAIITFAASAMGGREVKKAKTFIFAVIFLCSISSVVIAGVSYWKWDSIISLMLEKQDAIDYSFDMIHIYIFALIPDHLQIVLSACLRAIDKKIAGFVVTCISFYAIGIPIAFILCFKYGWEMDGLNWGMNFGFWGCFVVNIIFLLTSNLEKQSEKIYKKISEDKNHAGGKRIEDEISAVPHVQMPEED